MEDDMKSPLLEHSGSVGVSLPQASSRDGKKPRKVTVKIRGMECASCAVSIESVVGKMAGIESISVSPLQETVWTSTSHVITAVIGSGLLALPWSVAQIGWTISPIALVVCAFVTNFTVILLCDFYRTTDPVHGRRNHTYMEVVKSCLGPKDVIICGIAQYASIWGCMIGYTITVTMSLMVVERSNFLHNKGHGARCGTSGNSYMIIFGLVEIVLSQLPNLEKITLISVVVVVMSFAYSFIGLALCVIKFASHPYVQSSLLGVIQVDGVSATTKIWQSFQALGNVVFTYTYAEVLIEI